MTREEAIQWLKVINTKEFGWDEFALQESQREIRERCEQGVREAIDMAIEALSADAVPQLKQTDTLIIADALRYLAKDTERHLVDRTRADALRQQFLKYGASMCKGGDE